MVQVWGEPRLSGEVVVRQDGRFSLPLVQDVPAEGQTLTKITEILTVKLKEFIPTVTVDISLNQSAPIVYYLSGSFFKAGEYRTDKQVTLLQAIATGGGFAPFADKDNIMLIRRVLGQEKRYQLDYDDIVDGSEPNPQLQTGDVISVQ
jgi:polysaccharide export outer membrane protein